MKILETPNCFQWLSVEAVIMDDFNSLFWGELKYSQNFLQFIYSKSSVNIADKFCDFKRTTYNKISFTIC